MSQLILPGHPEFNSLAMFAPPDLKGNNETNLTYVIGADGMPRSINSRREFDEYLYGGEYQEVLDSHPEEIEDEMEIIHLDL